jgi:hypothetical protein
MSLAVVAASVGCGAAQPAAPPPQSKPAEAKAVQGKSTPVASDEADAPAEPARTLPTACSDPGAPVCVPPPGFVDRLCAKPHADAALALFAPAQPFTRMYLKGRLDELLADEEALVLRFHAPQKGGIVVGSGGGTYDLLRWDGTCATGVEAEAVTHAKPARPRTAHIQWHRIATKTQDALIASSDAVKRAHARRGKECKGAMSGDVSAQCARADEALVAAVVDYVRSGAALPPLEDVP